MCDEHRILSTRFLILGTALLTASIVVAVLFALAYAALRVLGLNPTPCMFAVPAVLFVPPALDLLLYRYHQAKYEKCERETLGPEPREQAG